MKFFQKCLISFQLKIDFRHWNETLNRFLFVLAVTKELTCGLEMVAKVTSKPNSAASGSHVSQVSIIFSVFNLTAFTEFYLLLQSIEWDRILGNCSKIYPELFPPQTPSAKRRNEFPKFNGTILQSSNWQNSAALSPVSSIGSPAMQGQRLTFSHESYIRRLVNENSLDFLKIKMDLGYAKASRRKLILIQALRWLLTQSSSQDRYTVMEMYIRSDLFGFQMARQQQQKSEENNSEKPAKLGQLSDEVLTTFLPSDAALWTNDDDLNGQIGQRKTSKSAASNSAVLAQQNSMSRFINAMASMKKGRDYLGRKIMKFHLN